MLTPEPEENMTESTRNLTSHSIGSDYTKKRSREFVPNGHFVWKLVENVRDEMSIEPMMFFHMVGYSCTTVIVQNLYIDRICRISHNFPDETCSNLTSYEQQEKIVEATVSIYKMYQSVIEALFPVLFALFLGPWTDKHGTKFPMLLSLFGYSASSILYFFASMFPDVHPKYLLLCSIPVSLTGGLVSLLLSAFTFISNRSTVPNRSFRIAVLEGCWFLGTPVGFLSSKEIFKTAGFLPVFLMSAASFGAAFLYGLFFIRESNKKSIPNSISRSVLADMFDIRSVRDTIMTVFRPRTGPRRKWMMILMVTIFLRMLALFGTMNVVYLYTRNKFGWETSKISVFSTIDTIVCLTGGLVTLVAMKVFQISDSVIGLFSAIGFTLANFVFAVASSGWFMYFGAFIQMFSGLITIVMRSMISKCVAKDELGKAFSFVSIGEACMPILAGLLFNLLYNSTVSSFPGAVFLVSSGLHAIILCIFVYFHLTMKKYPAHTLMEEQTLENNAL